MNNLYAIYQALLTSVFYASSYITAAQLACYFHPIALTGIRITLAMLCLAPFVEYREIYKVTRYHFLLFIGTAVTGFLLANIFFILAVSRAPLTNVAIINATLPLMTLFPACLIARKFPSWREVGAFFCALVGVILVISKGSLAGLLSCGQGELLMLLGNCAGVVNNLLLQVLGRYFSPLFLTFFSGCIGLLFLLPLGIIFGMGASCCALTVMQWGTLFLLALFGTALPFWGTSRAIIALGASKATFVIIGTVPLFVAAFAFIFYSEVPTLIQLCGGILVILSLPWGLSQASCK